MNIGESSVAEDQMLKDNDAILSGEITASTYEEASNKLNLFVAKNIDIMKGHLINKSSPDIHTMNKAMVEYMPVLYSLQTLYNKVKFNELERPKRKSELRNSEYHRYHYSIYKINFKRGESLNQINNKLH